MFDIAHNLASKTAFLTNKMKLTIYKSPEVKTEDGYSADIYPWRYMSALYPSSVFTSE